MTSRGPATSGVSRAREACRSGRGRRSLPSPAARSRAPLAGWLFAAMILGAAGSAAGGDAEIPVRVSLPTVEELEAWKGSGLRVEVGYGFGVWRSGESRIRDLHSHALVVRPRFRLDPHWSLAFELEYAVARGTMSGFAWSTTIAPVFHLGRFFSFAAGVGVTGLSVADRLYDWLPDNGAGGAFSSDVDRSVETRECSGVGLGAQARADLSLVVGPLFATGPFVAARARWTDCRAVRSSIINPETGHEIVQRQSWSHLGFAAGWTATWR